MVTPPSSAVTKIRGVKLNTVKCVHVYQQYKVADISVFVVVGIIFTAMHV